MTSLFPDLRADLVGAMEHGPRRRRAPMVAVAAVALAVAAVAGVARVDRPARPSATPTPAPDRVDVAGLPASIAATLRDGDFGQRPGTKRLELRFDDGVAWTVVAYRAKNGIVATTAAPDELRQPFAPTGGSSAAGMAGGPIAGVTMQGVQAGDGRRYLVAGLVEASARTVTIKLGNRFAEARTTNDAMAVGKLRVRVYAATLTGPLVHGPLGTVRPYADVTLADGSHKVVELARFCVTRRCGTVTPKLN